MVAEQQVELADEQRIWKCICLSQKCFDDGCWKATKAVCSAWLRQFSMSTRSYVSG
jgi:hypothetical protein